MERGSRGRRKCLLGEGGLSEQLVRLVDHLVVQVVAQQQVEEHCLSHFVMPHARCSVELVVFRCVQKGRERGVSRCSSTGTFSASHKYQQHWGWERNGLTLSKVGRTSPRRCTFSNAREK